MTIICHVLKRPVRVGSKLINARGQKFTVAGVSVTGKLLSDDPLLDEGFEPWSCSWPETDDQQKLRYLNTPTREQVLQWAQDAEMVRYSGVFLESSDDEVEHFAALAYAAGQAAEREARIKAQQDLAVYREAMTRAEHEAQRARGTLTAAVLEEREACAKVCEDWGRECHGEGRNDSEAFDCADHIRARSQQ